VSAPAFAIWWPVVGKDRLRYAMDVRPMELAGLESGSAELVRQLLGAAGVTASPTAWTITEFRSPYYADDCSAGEWRDRYPLVYRVDLVCAEPGDPLPEPHSPGPLACDVADPTSTFWPPDENENADCILIADLAADAEAAFRVAAERLAPTADWQVEPGGTDLVHMRFRLTGVSLAVDHPRVAEILRELGRLEVSLHWATTVALLDRRRG
jgi:hypothetical protein